MLSEKRSTRGKRMTELVGEALDQDSLFYDHETWNEEESDDSFEEEEIQPDEFDSDFNDTEDEDDSDSEDENIVRKKERVDTRKDTTSKYKEPKKHKMISKTNGNFKYIYIYF